MRITSKILELLVDSINEITKSPRVIITNKKHNIGHYHINYYFDSVSLYRTSNINGGVDEIYGPCSNKELYCFMTGYIRGYGDK